MDNEQVFDFANAVLATQTAILLGLINARVVEADKMRAFLKSLIDDLQPEERKQPYGVCLSNVLSGIEAMTLPKPKPASLN